MENQIPAEEISGFILELFRIDVNEPCFISSFEPDAVAGFNGYTRNKEEAVVFESREALLPLAAIEVEAIEAAEGDSDEEGRSMFDGFRILPYKGMSNVQLVSNEEMENALAEFENE